MRSSQKGFSVVEALLLLLATGIIAGTGWYVWNSSDEASKTLDTAASQKLATGIKKTTISTSDWQVYENKAVGLTYKYPRDWVNKENSIRGCSPLGAITFKASNCPLDIDLSSQSYIDYQTKKYGNLAGPLVNLQVFSASSQRLDNLYSELKSSNASQAGFKSIPSTTFTNNNTRGFYINQVTDSYSDNYYVIELAEDTFLYIVNRESDKHYSPDNGKQDDQNDYSQYTKTLEQIVKSIQKSSS